MQEYYHNYFEMLCESPTEKIGEDDIPVIRDLEWGTISIDVNGYIYNYKDVLIAPGYEYNFYENKDKQKLFFFI